MQLKHLTAPQKMPNIQFSRRANWAWPLARIENYCESKQTYISYSLHKAFYFARVSGNFIFNAKLSGRFLLRQPLKTQSAARQKAQDKLEKLDLLIWVKPYENPRLGGLGANNDEKNAGTPKYHTTTLV